MSDLHTAINELVEQRLKQVLRTGETINLPDWVDDFAASFADMIVQGAPEEEQLELAEYAVERLRYFIAECRNEMAEEGGHA
jgi:hypothetical protein